MGIVLARPAWRSQGARKAFGDRGTPRVAIVGGGFAGIAAAVKLQRAGIASFTIYEKSDLRVFDEERLKRAGCFNLGLDRLRNDINTDRQDG